MIIFYSNESSVRHDQPRSRSGRRRGSILSGCDQSNRLRLEPEREYLSGFSKLHSSLTASSLWNEPDKTRIVFITMLSMADSEGDVKASIVGLAHQARESLEDTEKALATLSSPDPHSGRKEEEGRRITPIDGGWHLVTHSFYRELGMSDETKRYWRDKKRKQRMSRTVKDDHGKSAKRASASVLVIASDSEKKGESEGKGKPKDAATVIAYVREIGLPEADGHYYWDKWQAGGYVNAGKPIRDWQALIRSHKSAGYCPSQKKGFGASSFQKPKIGRDPDELMSERLWNIKHDKKP